MLTSSMLKIVILKRASLPNALSSVWLDRHSESPTPLYPHVITPLYYIVDVEFQ